MLWMPSESEGVIHRNIIHHAFHSRVLNLKFYLGDHLAYQNMSWALVTVTGVSLKTL